MKEMTQLQQEIRAAFPQAELRFEESLARHTSFKIGGPAEVMAFPRRVEELSEMLAWARARGISPRILGAGTNVLAPDQGVRGLILCTKGCLNGMERISDREIRVQSGVTMARAAVFAAELGLSGLEFAHGIPGTVGGGVYMNAGAYGGEIRQVAEKTTALLPDGSLWEAEGEAQGFSYRHSVLETTSDSVICAEFTLTPAQPEEIKARMKELIGKRSASQPLDLPSAGSAF